MEEHDQEAADRRLAEDPSSTRYDPEPLGDPVPVDPAKPVYFDAFMHERVQRLHKKGIWTDMGQRWGGMLLRLKPFHVHSVVVRRETAEQRARIQLSLNDDDPIPAEQGIEINRVTVAAAISGCKVLLNPSPEMLDLANQYRFKTIQHDGLTLIEFTGDEDGEAVRTFFLKTLLEQSMPFMTTAIRAARQLQKVRDAEIDRLGEGFIFGQHVMLDFKD